MRIQKKKGFIAFEWIFAAAFVLLFTVVNVPNMFDDGVRTYELITENNKKLVYEELTPDSGIHIDKGSGETIHKPDIDEDEIQAPDESGNIDDGKAHVDSIKVDISNVVLDVGESAKITHTLVSTIPGQEINNKGVTWSSDNRNVAYVAQDGTITAIAPGAATVTVRSHDSNKSAFVYVTVNPILATDILLNTTEIKLQAYNSFQIVATVVPVEATNQECIYSIEDESIASVDSSGLVVAKNVTRDNYKTYVIVRNGTVEKRIPLEVEGTMIPTDDIILKNTSYNVQVGSKVKIEASVSPANATIQDFVYRSLDEYYATVDGLGNIIGQNEGQTYVDVCNTGADFFGAEICRSVLVNVTPANHPLVGLNIGYESMQIQSGRSLNPIITYNPTYTTNKALIWTSSNPEAVSVDDNGVITGRKDGISTITATSVSNPSISASFIVQSTGYVNRVTVVEIYDQDIVMNPGMKHQLNVGVFPEDATDKTLTYKTSDSAIAVVNSNGVITAIKPGVVIISATSNDGGVTASTIVTVEAIATTSVSWDIGKDANNIKKVTLDKGESLAVGVTILPVNATDKSLTFRAGTSSIANYIDGYVHAYEYGETTITVIGANGATDILNVVVREKKAESISVAKNPIELFVGEETDIIPTILPVDVKNKEVYYNTLNNQTTITEIRYEKKCKIDTATKKEICTIEKVKNEKSGEVIKIDKNGHIEALNPGTATVLLTSASDTSVTTEVVINVKGVKSKSIAISSANPMVFDGINQTGYIEAAILPADTSNQELIFHTNTDGVVSVDDTGLITTTAYGETDVYVLAADNIVYDNEGNINYDKSIYAVVHIIVEDKTIRATGLKTTDNLDVVMYVGNKKQLNVSVEPSNATDKNIEWLSLDTSVATVSSTGLLTAVGKGTTTVIASHSDGFSIEYTVTVREQDITKFVVSPSTMIIGIGQTVNYSIDSIPTSLSTSAYVAGVYDEDGEISNVVNVNVNNKTITGVKEGIVTVVFDVPDFVGDENSDDFKNSIEVIVKDESKIWDGSTIEKPEIVNNSCIIKSAANLAWVSQQSQTNLTCTTLDIQTDIDLLGNSMRSIADAKTDGIYLNILGNGHVIENGTFYAENNNAGMVSKLNTSSVKKLTLNNITVKGKANTTNLGILAGEMSGGYINDVEIYFSKIDNTAVTKVANAGYLVGKIDDSVKNTFTAQNLSIRYNGLSNAFKTTYTHGAIAGLIENTKMLTSAFTIESNSLYANSSGTYGEFFGNVKNSDLDMTNFSVINEIEETHSIIGKVDAQTDMFVANYYLTFGLETMPIATNIFAQTGNFKSFESLYGYYAGDLNNATNNKIAANVASSKGLIEKSDAEMYDNEAFVTLLNKATGYMPWVAEEEYYPRLSSKLELNSITLLNKELAIFTGLSTDVSVDTSYVGTPLGARGDEIVCTSLNTDIVNVDKNTCIATAGTKSGETKIRVTVDNKLYDDVTVTSYPISDVYSEPAALTNVINQMLVREYAAGKIIYKYPTSTTWSAKTKNIYGIEYILNGGSASGNAIKYSTEESFTVKDPTKTGYTFTGWDEVIEKLNYKDGFINVSTGKIEKSSSYPNASYSNKVYVEKNKTYTVSTVGDYQVRLYDLDDNYLGNASISSNKFTASQAGYARLLLLDKNVDAGATSYLKRDDKLKGYVIPKGSEGNKKLTANWVNNTYTVKYNGNGATSGSMSNSSHTYDVSKVLNTNAFARTGYTFAGWATSATGNVVYANGATVKNLTGTANGTVNLYAKWNANAYVITFNANGGYVSTTTKAINFGNALGTLPTPTKTGYTFNGWFTAASGGTKWTATTVYQNAGNTTLYAQWTANTYQIKYNGNGSTSGSMSNSTHTYDVAKKLTGNTFIKTGYTFAGWSTAPTGGVVYTNEASVINLSASANGIVNLYAVWSTDQYTISYNLNGGTVATANPTTYNVTSASITLKNPTKTGYNFTGWTGSNGTNPQTAVIITKGSTGNKSYTANWSAISYAVKYNGNGATSGTMANSIHVYDTSKTLTSNAYTRTGYTFKGWATSASGSVAYGNAASVKNLSSTANAVVELFAVWEQNSYAISYNLNGGAVATANPTSYKITTADITLNNPTKTGYTFIGWTGSNGTSAQKTVVISKGSTGNKSYTANWTANTYQVKYNGNGATSGTMANGTHTYDTAKALTANAFVRRGYTFAGWATSASGSVAYANKASVKNLTATAGGTVNLYAKWTANSYTLTFNANGGSVATSSKTVTYGSVIGTLPTPSRTGYTFSGWYTATSGGTQWTSATVFTNTTNTTLYARWTANTYQVKYNGNGATSGTMANSTHAYDTAKALTSNAYVRTGYTFKGWSTSASGSVVYANAASVKNLSSTANAVINLYAIWGQDTYTISYNLNGGSVATANPTSYTVTTANITLNNPTKTGYTFAGWTGSNGTSAQKTVVISKGSTGNKTYTANWTANTYQVKYNGNGATSGTMANGTHTYDTAKALTANAFVRSGYTFAGWATSASGSVAYADKASVKNLTTTAGGTVNLYAKWTANSYTLTFNANGGSVGTSSKTVTYGSAIGTLPTPTRTGYTFNGWYTAISGGTKWTSTTVFTNAGNVILYARWTANKYTLTFNPNGGSLSPTSIPVNYTLSSTGATLSGDKIIATATSGTTSTQIKANATLEPNTKYSFTVTITDTNITTFYPSMTGNIAIGNVEMSGTWTQSGNVWTYTFTTPSTITGTEIKIGYGGFYIQWANAQYTATLLTLDMKKGESSASTKSVTYNKAVGTLPTPTRIGYAFNGWYTASSGGTRWTESTVYSTVGNTTLYAQWTALNAEVKVYNDITGDTTTHNIQYGTSKDIGTLSAAGYNFKSYSTTNASIATVTGTKINALTTGSVEIRSNWTMIHPGASSYTVNNWACSNRNSTQNASASSNAHYYTVDNENTSCPNAAANVAATGYSNSGTSRTQSRGNTSYICSKVCDSTGNNHDGSSRCSSAVASWIGAATTATLSTWTPNNVGTGGYNINHQMRDSRRGILMQTITMNNWAYSWSAYDARSAYASGQNVYKYWYDRNDKLVLSKTNTAGYHDYTGYLVKMTYMYYRSARLNHAFTGRVPGCSSDLGSNWA